MKEITLEVKSRSNVGKGTARKLRASGKIPAVIYGKNESPMSVELDYALFHNAMRKASGENPLITLHIDGKDSGKKAIIKEMQKDPVSGALLHIDLQHVSLTEKIRVNIPIILEGTAEGVKNFGGIMSWIVRQVEVSCLPTQIPDKITFDVSALKIHDSIHVKNIKIEGIEILNDPEETIVSIIPPTVIKEAAPVGEGEAGIGVATEEQAGEPEVISEKKAEDRREEKKEKEGK